MLNIKMAHTLLSNMAKRWYPYLVVHELFIAYNHKNEIACWKSHNWKLMMISNYKNLIDDLHHKRKSLRRWLHYNQISLPNLQCICEYPPYKADLRYQTTPPTEV
jgi:hypothetical protein